MPAVGVCPGEPSVWGRAGSRLSSLVASWLTDGPPQPARRQRCRRTNRGPTRGAETLVKEQTTKPTAREHVALWANSPSVESPSCGLRWRRVWGVWVQKPDHCVRRSPPRTSAGRVLGGVRGQELPSALRAGHCREGASQDA